MILTLSLATATLFAAALGNDKNSNDTAGRYKVASTNSTVKWTGKKVTGQHSGTIAIKSGTVSVMDGMIEAADIVIDMTTITCTDTHMGQENKDKLVGHLNSPDFFDVSEHSTATFRLKTFTSTSEEGKYNVSGELTIKGITNPIEFPATVTIKDNEITATADLTFDRSKYNVRYGSGSFFDNLGDNMIYDDVEVSFSIVANQ